MAKSITTFPYAVAGAPSRGTPRKRCRRRQLSRVCSAAPLWPALVLLRATERQRHRRSMQRSLQRLALGGLRPLRPPRRSSENVRQNPRAWAVRGNEVPQLSQLSTSRVVRKLARLLSLDMTRKNRQTRHCRRQKNVNAPAWAQLRQERAARETRAATTSLRPPDHLRANGARAGKPRELARLPSSDATRSN